MPNWCNNRLTVTGDAGRVVEFVERAKPREHEVRAAYDRHVAWQLAHLPDRADEIQPLEEYLNERFVNSPISFVSHVPLGEQPGAWDYDLAVQRWGTKWDACFFFDDLPIVLALPDEFFVEFVTAWGPPLAWLKAVSEAHPELEFRLGFDEPDMRLAGEHRYVAGVCVEETKLEVVEHDEETPPA
jgi:hypothetical protein